MWEIALFFIGTNFSLNNAINLGNWNFYGNIKLKAFLNSFLTCEIFSLISTLNRILIFCVEFRELFHLTCDLSQAEKKTKCCYIQKSTKMNCWRFWSTLIYSLTQLSIFFRVPHLCDFLWPICKQSQFRSWGYIPMPYFNNSIISGLPDPGGGGTSGLPS